MKNLISCFFYMTIGAAILSSCSNHKTVLATTSASLPILKTVQVQKAESINYQTSIFSAGKLINDNAFDMSFNHSGKVSKMLVHSGQKVSKGQLLATLDIRIAEVSAQNADIEIEQANLSIKNTTLLLEKAQRDFKNITGLYKDSVATLEQFENIKTEVQTIENQLLQNQQSQQALIENRKVIDINIDDAKIIAPTDGIVLKNHKKENEITNIGEPVFLFAPKSNAKVLQVFISDKEVVQIEKGDNTEVTFDVYASKTFRGEVIEIASIAHPISNKFEIKIRLDPVAEKLFLGFIGNVVIYTTQTRVLTSIPIDALLEAEGKKGNILTVENERVNKKEVTIYKIENNQLLIQSGLAEGELVVTSGSGNIKNGEKVQINKTDGETLNDLLASKI